MAARRWPVLVRSIVNEGVRMISGANAMRLATGVRAAVDATVQLIRQQTRPASDENALAAVALTTTRAPPFGCGGRDALAARPRRACEH